MSEQLLDDLNDYFVDCEIFGKRLAHPLVHVIGIVDVALINKMYSQKKLQVEQALEDGRFSLYVHLHEKPYRVNALDEIAHLIDNHSEYWTLLGDVCVGTENQWQDKDVLRELLTIDRPERNAIMNADEYEEYKALPETLTVYRGCHKGKNEDGFSWTLDKDRAQWFAERLADDDDVPKVIEKTIRKSEVIALFTRRSEQEVLLIDN